VIFNWETLEKSGCGLFVGTNLVITQGTIRIHTINIAGRLDHIPVRNSDFLAFHVNSLNAFIFPAPERSTVTRS
jgi:hypothetical protein